MSVHEQQIYNIYKFFSKFISRGKSHILFITILKLAMSTAETDQIITTLNSNAKWSVLVATNAVWVKEWTLNGLIIENKRA
jgi:hypothetical protein